MHEYDNALRKIILNTAKAAILQHLQNKRMVSTNINDYPDKLRQSRACFVTLHLNGQLRGCIGSLLAHQPLIIDVIHNSYNAAFKDPRFQPVTINEYPKLHLDISVLTTPEPITFNSEAELLQQLRPGIDGLILSDHGHRGTFLPSVWEQLPEPLLFLKHLKNKAGLPEDYWSSTLKVERYQTEFIYE